MAKPETDIFRLQKSSVRAFGIDWGTTDSQEWLKMRENWLQKEVSKRLSDTMYDCNGFMKALLSLLTRTLPVGIQTGKAETASHIDRSFPDGTRLHQDIFESFIFRNVFRIKKSSFMYQTIF